MVRAMQEVQGVNMKKQFTLCIIKEGRKITHDDFGMPLLCELGDNLRDKLIEYEFHTRNHQYVMINGLVHKTKDLNEFVIEEDITIEFLNPYW